MHNISSFSELVHDEKSQQFRMSINGEVAVVDYRIRDGIMLLVHSEVPYELRGQGVGQILVEKVFEYIDHHNIRASAVCSFIASVAKRSDKWKEVIL